MSKKDPVLADAKNWLNENSGKTLKDYYRETGYNGPKLKTKQRAGQPAIVGYRTEASTTGPTARRTDALKQQDLEYIDTWKKAGFTETTAMEALGKAKSKGPALVQQVRELNRQHGPHSFSVGHETAAIQGGGDFDRNRRLEKGKGSGGNFFGCS